MTDDGTDWIHLRSFSFGCVMGLLEWEQREVQKLQVEIHMNLDLDAAASGDIRRSVNYAATVEQLQFLAQHGRWLLLESMAAAMARHILAPPAPAEERAQVENVIVHLEKPEVFRGRAIPSIEIRRNRKWAQLRTVAGTEVGNARIEVLQETRETGAYRIHLMPGTKWTIPPGMSLHLVAGEAQHAGQHIPPSGSLARGGATVTVGDAEEACFIGVSQPPLTLSN